MHASFVHLLRISLLDSPKAMTVSHLRIWLIRRFDNSLRRLIRALFLTTIISQKLARDRLALVSGLFGVILWTPERHRNFMTCNFCCNFLDIFPRSVPGILWKFQTCSMGNPACRGECHPHFSSLHDFSLATFSSGKVFVIRTYNT